MLKMEFHEGFTERLLSGSLEFDGLASVKYTIKGFRIEQRVGAFEVPEKFNTLYQEVVSKLEQLNDVYESGWDDLGHERIIISSEALTKTIKIDGPIERTSLSQHEIMFFELKNLLISEVYKRV